MGQHGPTWPRGDVAGPLARFNGHWGEARPLVLPEVIESGRVHLRVTGGILDLLVAEVGRQRQGVDPVVDELEARGMSQVVRMNVGKSNGLGRTAEVLKKATGRHRSAPFSEKYIARTGILTAQLPQRANFSAAERMNRVFASLAPDDFQSACVKVDLRPSEADQFADAQAMPKGHQDHRCVPVAVTTGFAGCCAKLLHLAFREVFSAVGLIVFALCPQIDNFPTYSGWGCGSGWLGSRRFIGNHGLHFPERNLVSGKYVG